MKLPSTSCVAVGFLLVVCPRMGWCTTRAPAQTIHDATEGETLDGTMDGILSHVWAAYDGAVKMLSREVANEVSEGFTEVRTQCLAHTGQLSQLSSQLVTVKTELDTKLEAQNAAVDAHGENLTLRLDVIGSDLSATNAQLSELRENISAQTAGLKRVQEELTSTRSELVNLPRTSPRDCSDLPPGSSSGVHLLKVGLQKTVPAFCDQDTDSGGWTVLLRRADIEPRRDFFLGWEAYKWGFGELDAEFWWGLEHLWLMTAQLDRRYELRIDLEDFDGETRHAVYQGFRIASETDNYRLRAVNYTGDAGDSLVGHNGHQFSTKDRDNDIYGTSCAESFKGAWWYTKCHSSNLNGRYHAGQHESYADGVNWSPWRGYYYSLKTATMKIRPTKKL